MFLPSVAADAMAHALAEFPRESCGLVIAGVYVPKANLAPDQAQGFSIDRRAWLTEQPIQGVVHSHCAAPGSFAWSDEQRRAAEKVGHGRWPSAEDMAGQVASGVPWGIVWTDGIDVRAPVWWGDFVLDEKLIGREFAPGIRDCYGLLRAWMHQERSITLKEFPRDDQWWSRGGDLFRQGFEDAGYRLVNDRFEVGDVVLMQILAKVPNHCAVVLERGLILHHLTNRLSRREPIGPWQRHITHHLRFQG